MSSVPTLKLSQLWFTKNFASSVSFKHSVLFVVKDSAACQAALLPKTRSDWKTWTKDKGGVQCKVMQLEYQS